MRSLQQQWESVTLVAAVVLMVTVGWGCDPCVCACLKALGFYDQSGQSPNLPLGLEWNLGQADAAYQVVGRGGGYGLYLNGSEAMVEFGRDARVQLRLEGAQTAPVEALDMLPGKVNYFLGSQPEYWITDVPTFRRAKYRNVYPGVDIVYYGHGSDLEHDFVVHPGADPARIAMSFSGASRKRINADGDLVLEAAGGELIWKAPRLYQEVPMGRRKVEGAYRVNANGTVGFEVGIYDLKRDLVIDPVIVYASNIGGNGSEYGARVAVDRSGNTYMVGSTVDTNYRVSPNAPTSPTNTAASGDVTVTKLNADGSAVMFTTRIGGGDFDLGLGAAVDGAGNIYITGVTRSVNFPTADGSYRTQVPNPSQNIAERNDCFITKIASAGNRLVYSTYLGGTSPDVCSAIAVDSSGAAYVAGSTNSGNFPLTGGVFQGRLVFGQRALQIDAFVAKLNPEGSGLVYSSYLGGNGNDLATGIAVDGAGNAYVVGTTDSSGSFPVTQGAFQTAFKGAGRPIAFEGNSFMPDYTLGVGDGFLVKVDPLAEKVLYGTYFGGRDNDVAFGVAVDARGAVYVSGNTLSTDFPVSDQAAQKTFKGAGAETRFPAGDAFALKFEPSGALGYATYLGGSLDDRAGAIAVDANGNAWVAGSTLSKDFPVTTDGAQRTYSGEGGPGSQFRTGDAFVAQLDASGKAIVYASYIGGASDDYAAGVVVDAAGSVYVSGGTSSQDFPTTRGAAQAGYGGHIESFRPAGDAFVAKIGEAPRVEEPKPAIAAVANLASGVGGSIAPGEIVAIGGTNLGPATAVTANAVEGRFAAVLSETRVWFGDTPSPVLSTSAALVTAVAPFGLAVGSTAQVVVEYKGVKSPAVAVPVVAAVPGLFTVSGAGRGQATAANEDGSANSVENRAVAGSIITLNGTGAGLTDPASTDGAVADEDFPPLAQPVTVLFGDTPAEEVYFSGGVKGRVAGFFQVQLRIPASVPEGEIPVTVKIGDAATQTGVTIAVAPAVPPSE
ncbi:MAG: SBBP repeat-containing protein [Bryobacteraceae bacterium]|nr:SBBP repeat-containing protein [Bryobacteraceae bacterium]